ncbi:Phospholipid:diacylglycerol acyltransferase [Phytophthora cinnamomi]|uniref:Phospholipid:diacylglycerol acyltransferase n=1 Tax=Phytophthora cinnamomi TaxID=4785 RepID=UPI00355A00B8|nr:Phospholipid:diacylglycerol acyltransferase [Phytophthora cinnamomi]
MSKVNNGFAYVFNTAQEGRKVARVLSGWDADAAPVVLVVAAPDHGAQERLMRLREFLLSICAGLKEHSLNVSSKVLTVPTAYLVRYYPQLKALAPERVEECLSSAGISTADALALAVVLNEQVEPEVPPRIVTPINEDLKYEVLVEALDAPSNGHLVREMAHSSVFQTFWWYHVYKQVATYVRTCEMCEKCQRVKLPGHDFKHQESKQEGSDEENGRGSGTSVGADGDGAIAGSGKGVESKVDDTGSGEDLEESKDLSVDAPASDADSKHPDSHSFLRPGGESAVS